MGRSNSRHHTEHSVSVGGGQQCESFICSDRADDN